MCPCKGIAGYYIEPFASWCFEQSCRIKRPCEESPNETIFYIFSQGFVSGRNSCLDLVSKVSLSQENLVCPEKVAIQQVVAVNALTWLKEWTAYWSCTWILESRGGIHSALRKLKMNESATWRVQLYFSTLKLSVKFIGNHVTFVLYIFFW